MLSSSSQAFINQFRALPESEKTQVRSLINEQNLSHEEVFGFLREEEFTVHEATEYLGISEPTFRRAVKAGKITASSTVGRSNLYALKDLRAFKKARKKN